MTVTTKAPPTQRRMAKPSSTQLRLDAIEQRLERLEAALESVVVAVEHLLATAAEPGVARPIPVPRPAETAVPSLGPPPPEPTFGLLSNAEGYRHPGDGRDPYP